MKRLFLLIAVCMVLPQSVFAVATVTVSGGTVTINTDKAGDLEAYLQSATPEEKTAISSASTIVFKGKYNSNDLQALSDAGCCTQSTVNMSEAYFIASSSSSSKILYHKDEDRQSANEGDHCLVGAKKHVVASSRSTWVPIEESEIPANADGTKNITTISEEDFGSYINNNEEYIRVPKAYNYYKVIIENYNRSYESVDVSEIPSDATIHTPTVPDEEKGNVMYNYQDANHNSITVNVGDYMRFGTSFNYYTNPETLIWKDVSGEGDYTDGTSSSNCYQSVNVAPTPTYEIQNTPIYIGGTESVYHDGQWVDPSEVSGNEEYDYTQMSFSYWGTNVKTAITSNNVLSENDHLSSGIFSGCTNLENITLGSGVFDFKIGNASDFTKIENIVVKKDVVQLGSVGSDGDGFFPSSSSLKTVTFETGGTTPLKLGKSCFNGCTKIESVTIPARTQLIEQYAFGGTNDSKLAVVKFNDDADVTYPMVIKHEAFNNQKHITDVWVDINPDVRPLVCEYEAFDFDTMDGQTTPTNPMAVLHFNKDYFDYYAGNWKKGMSLGHLDLGVIRDGDGFVSGGATITKGTNSQLVNQTTSTAILGSQSSDLLKTGQIKDKKPANGWQQFARTDTGIDIIIEKGKDFRTYSTEVALVKPDWMHIYRVTNFDDGFKENSDASSREEADAAHKVATTQEIVVGVEGVANCIPMNTGVIRVDNVTNDAIYYIMEWKDLKSAGIEYDDSWEYPYVDDNTKTKVNFMKPTSTPDSNPEFTIIGPVEKNGSGEITHRVFGLKKVQNDNGITGEFLRAKVNTKMARNRAYLSLPADLFHWIDESTSSTQPATGTIPANNTNNAKISLIIDTDFDLGLNNGIATAIQQVIEKDMYKDDTFYTLQGVKVSKPTTKGVYIHNGKKVLIK